jgi:hypothetical protein
MRRRCSCRLVGFASAVPSFARYHSAIAAATALEAAKAEKVKKARERAAEQPQAEEWRPETVATSHRARLSIDLELLLAASAVG